MIQSELNSSTGESTQPSDIKRSISTISTETEELEKTKKKPEDENTGKMIDEERSETGRVRKPIEVPFID